MVGLAVCYIALQPGPEVNEHSLKHEKMSERRWCGYVRTPAPPACELSTVAPLVQQNASARRWISGRIIFKANGCYTLSLHIS